MGGLDVVKEGLGRRSRIAPSSNLKKKRNLNWTIDEGLSNQIPHACSLVSGEDTPHTIPDREGLQI